MSAGPVSSEQPGNEFGAVDGRRNVRLTMNDPAGVPVTLKLSGPGTGAVTLTGDRLDIRLEGTTTRSSLTVSTPRSAAGTMLGEVRIDGSLKRMTAKAADLGGELIVGGWLGGLAMRDVVRPSRLTIAEGPREMKLSFRRVSEFSIDSATPISSLKAAEWLDQNASPDRITAPWAGTVDIDGDFGADLILSDNKAGTALGKLDVAGVIDAATIRTNYDIQRLICLAARNTLVLAGVKDDVSGLPDSLDDFARRARIRSFVATGVPGVPSVENSSLAAALIGKLAIGAVASAENGAPFGVVADRVDSYRRVPPPDPVGISAEDQQPVRLRRVDEPGVVEHVSDFRLTIL